MPITLTAFAVFAFSLAATLGSIGTALLWRRGGVRRMAARIGLFYGILAITAGYVGLDLGPKIDRRLAAAERPQIPRAVSSFDI